MPASSYSPARVVPAIRPAFVTVLVANLAVLAVLTAVVALGGASGSGIFRGAVRAWLVSHGSGISVGTTDFTVVPLGAALVAVVAVALAARWVAADPIDEPAAFAAAVGGFHGVMLGVLSTLTNANGIETGFLRASAGGFVLGAVGAAIGYALRHGVPEAWQPKSGTPIDVGLRAGARAVVIVLSAAAVLVLLLLAVHAEQSGEIWAGLAPNFVGAIVLILTSLLALPTLVAWAVAALVGPGFAVGTETSVDLTGSHVGQVPAFPVLAALPGPGEFGGWVFVLALIPAAAGALAGWRAARELAKATLQHQCTVSASAGAGAGLVLGIVAGLSGGALGPGRMSEVGPHALSTALVAVPTLAAAAVIGACVAHYGGSRGQ